MRRRFKIRQEIGANNFLHSASLLSEVHGVDAGQPPQDIGDSSRFAPVYFDAADHEKRIDHPPLGATRDLAIDGIQP